MRESPSMELLRILAIPFQLASLLFVALTSVLLAIALPDLLPRSFVLGAFILWFVTVWLTRYAFRLVDEVANGVRQAAVAEIEMTNPFGDPRCWVHPALGVGLVVAHYFNPRWPVAPTLLAAALLFPPSIAACAMSGRARDALNPLAVARVVQGLGLWYPLTVLAVVACVSLGTLLARQLGMGWVLYAILEILLLVAYASIGGAIYMRRIELGFAARISPEQRAVAAELEREARRQQWLDDLYKLVRARDAAGALVRATQWLDAAAPLDIAGDVQALIAAGHRWNEPREYARLLRSLLPTLLARRQPALALAAFDAGMAVHAPFAPAEEPTAFALADYAMQTGRKRAALRLLDNYLAVEASASAPGTRLAALRDSLRSRS